MASLLEERRSVVWQVADALRQSIVATNLHPGDRIQSEAQLGSRYGVARGTVREALKLLEQEGLIQPRHGLGYFISALASLHVDRPVTTFESVTDMLVGLGFRPETRVLSVETGPPDPTEQSALHVAPDTSIVRVERLRLVRGQALVYQANSFPAHVVGPARPQGRDFAMSLTTYLARHDVELVSAAARIRAEAPPAHVLARREVDAEQPWLLIEEECIDASGHPMLYSRDYHRGDVFSFRFLRRRVSPSQDRGGSR